jgi:hypothetical protein
MMRKPSVLKSKDWSRVVEEATSEVETMAIWRSLSVKDRQKAIRLLLGPHWRQLYKGVIERYESSLGRI